MTDVRYRQATLADVPAMARSRNGDRAAGPADDRMAAYLAGDHHPQQALSPRAAYLALAQEAVVGYIFGHLTRRYECDGEVQSLYVAPGHRRAGIAGKLLQLQARWFREHDAHRICVNVDPANSIACAFYESRGALKLRRAWYVWIDIGRLDGGAEEVSPDPELGD